MSDGSEYAGVIFRHKYGKMAEANGYERVYSKRDLAIKLTYTEERIEKLTERLAKRKRPLTAKAKRGLQLLAGAAESGNIAVGGACINEKLSCIKSAIAWIKSEAP